MIIRRDDTYLIAGKLEKQKRMTFAISAMADNVIGAIIAQDKSLIRTYYNVLIGGCSIYAIASGIDLAGLALARNEVETCGKRVGLEADYILKYIW